MKAYPRGFVGLLWWLAALLLVSGLLLVPGMLSLRLAWEVPDALMGPRTVYAAAHGLVAFSGLVLFGALLGVHVRHGLRQRHCRRTGTTLLVLLPVLMLAGWGIYYLADERAALGASLLHVAAAACVTIALLMHWFAARRRQGEIFRFQSARSSSNRSD